MRIAINMICAVLLGAAAGAAPETPAKKSVLSPEKAGRAEGVASGYSRKAVICDWLATRHAGEPADTYAGLAEAYRAVAAQKWRVWQAYHFDDADLLKQADADCRPLTRQAGDLEKRLKSLGTPRPDVKVFDGVAEREPAAERLAKSAEHERSAIQCERQAHVHNYRSEKRREDYQRYNLAMSETYALLAEQHWHVWRACLLNDIDVMVKAQANVRILRGRLDGYRRERDDYQDASRSSAAGQTVENNEALAVNHGMRAVKCGQIALQVDGELKQTYLDLADNFRKASQLRRDMANAVAARNDGALPALEIKILTLRDERQALWDREKALLETMQQDSSKIDQRRKIAEFKREYKALREQVAQITGAD